MSTQPASFSLSNFCFPKINLDLNSVIEENQGVAIGISPKGIYRPNEQKYLLHIHCYLTTAQGIPFLDILCEATFLFNQDLAIEDIPGYFYPNSVAIVFPYIRAMVSTLSLQANMMSPIILPTMNLSNLQEDLKKNTIVE